MTGKIYHWLMPVAWVYGLVVRLRNKLFDMNWLRQKSYDLPVICVGNLAVGGTGKTPYTEYLIRLLQNNGLNVATLSRGYKRRTKGYILSTAKSDVHTIGDEPYQIKYKFPRMRVAVDENRCHGIEELLKLENPQVDAVLLDDAFQHRYVKAGLSILLTDCHRLICDDELLPAGKLREPEEGKFRADIVIVTKCPDGMNPSDFNFIAKRLQLNPSQHLYFSKYRYRMLQPLFPHLINSHNAITPLVGDEQVLLVTGIASPRMLLREVKSYTRHVRLLRFNDHHHFNHHDLDQMKRLFFEMEEWRRLIITTEKDATRLLHHPELDDALKPYIYVLPIDIEILQNHQEIFNQNIIDYVRTNPRDSRLHKKQHAHAS
ncbi:MAG: tetraacyldisaccharide 4'-kinase [Prevotellaceae bacterium]|nr:tetraacyldisaccharide 4'-kinase [Prevotellaceae bacterium]